MLEICVLGSGSSGNCAVVRSQAVTLLIDAGLSAKQIRLRLGAVGIAPESLDGILLTHEHGDHVRGLDVFCRAFPVPVICTPLTRECLLDSLHHPKQWKLAPTGGAFSLGDLEVRLFSVPHDAVDPVGIVIEDRDSVLGVVSDVGSVNNVMRNHLMGANTVFVEANYDERMLHEDEKRPWSTKQRIAAHHGHLSNAQTASLVTEIASERLERVILGHLSDDCNCPEVAVRTVAGALGEAGFGHVDVRCAPRREPTERWPVAMAKPSGAPSASGSRVAEKPPGPGSSGVGTAIGSSSRAAPAEVRRSPHSRATALHQGELFSR